MAKKYYWLKFQMDFFQSPVIKKLRKIAGGDTYTIIYLKLQLMSVPDGGIIKLIGLEDDPADEIALMIDEETDNVKVTLGFLQRHGLLEVIDGDFFLPQAAENIGNETDSAKRMRKMRKSKDKGLLEETDKNNENKTRKIELLNNETSQCDALPSHCDNDVTVMLQKSDDRGEERREDKEKELELECRYGSQNQVLLLQKIFFSCFKIEPEKSFLSAIKNLIESGTGFTRISDAIEYASKMQPLKAEPYILAYLKNKKEEDEINEQWLLEIEKRREIDKEKF